MTNRTGLARQTATRNGGDDVELAIALRHVERLLDHHALRGARKVDRLVAAVDGDLARAGLDPHAGDSVLAAASGVSAALAVDFLLADRRRSLDAGNDRRLLQFGKGRKFGSHVSRSSNSWGS